jgi:hypothetical protein
MNLKKCLRNKGCNDIGPAHSPTAASLFRKLDCHRQTIAALDVPGSELHNPHPEMVRRNSQVGGILGRIRQPCSLNIQAKYETLPAGRLDSLS